MSLSAVPVLAGQAPPHLHQLWSQGESTETSSASRRLRVVMADALPAEFAPPDELVEGLLTAGAGSVFYGDSNSGKTFLVIDLAAAVARGVSWMGRCTEPGLVVYLAAESPASVNARLQAYQQHHGVTVPNFAIVQSPIDLFDGEADTNAVIELVRRIEQEQGAKVRLIVGDTLARLSAGANENSGEDMGRVVRHFDRIREETGAHFLLIHHSGKNAAAGARGWSGIRAAMDTEVELTETQAGRCLEVTKQRDLGTKGERIGFSLEVVTLGQTKWGKPNTSCVVRSANAPQKVQAKRRSKVARAVMNLLNGQGKGMSRAELAKRLDAEGVCRRTSAYKAMDQLKEAGELHEAAGVVALVKR